jgi:hypothetical protein
MSVDRYCRREATEESDCYYGCVLLTGCTAFSLVQSPAVAATVYVTWARGREGEPQREMEGDRGSKEGEREGGRERVGWRE